VAARLRKEFDQEVDQIKGRYGDFQVAVDGKTVLDAGSKAFLGIVPSRAKIIDAVRAALAPS
jgi:hypothetical protein